MAIMAAGHEAKNDPFRSATDSKWWSRSYRVDLWTNLATYLETQGDDSVDFDEDIANQSQVALNRALAIVTDYLTEIRSAGWGHCAPYIVPVRPKLGQWPIVNVTCVRIPDKLDPTPVINARPTMPWGWLLIIAAVALSRRKRG
jgi:hypothetical protein